jgi:hypothetical protein
MIIGYSILYVEDDNVVKDTNLTKRIIYSTWEKALERASIEADEIKSKYGNEMSYVSIFRADSKKLCDKNGATAVYRFIYKKSNIEFGNLYIVTVLEE